MNTLPLKALALLSGLVILSASAARAQVVFTGSYTQAFTTGLNGVDSGTMINTAGNYTWTDNSSIVGWYAVVDGATPAQYHATNTNGNNGTPNALKLARASGTSGALGLQRSSTNTGFTAFGVQLTNSTEAAIGGFDISYLGQQWQDNTGGIDTLTFQYSTDATSLTTGTWTTVNDLAFGSVQDTNAGPTNYVSLAPTGSSVAPGETISGTISGLTLAEGATIWFRWVDENNTGVDDVLTIDNLSITSTAIPEPASAALLLGIAGLAARLGLRSRRRDSR